MLLMFLLYTVAEPGSQLDLPPADDPAGRWIATTVAVLTVLGPLAAAKLQAKKGATNGPSPSTPVESATPRLDVTQGYLERYVASLEKRVEHTEAKNDELDRKNLELLDKLSAATAQIATMSVQLEQVHAANLELRDQVHMMQGQLRGRGQ